MKKWTIWMLALLIGVANTQGQNDPSKYGVDEGDGDLPVGLQVGELAPDFSLKSSAGELVQLENELRKGPVVLIFYRGIWCPVCNRYLSNVQDSLRYVTEAGASLLAVTGEVQQYAAEMAEDVGAEFPILIDADEEVMKAYDVLFTVTDWYDTKVKVGQLSSIEKNTGQEDARLPVPATYVIDQDGKIVFVQFDYNYKVRASVKDMLDALKKIN